MKLGLTTWVVVSPFVLRGSSSYLLEPLFRCRQQRLRLPRLLCDLDALAKSMQGCSIKVLAEGGVLDGFLKPSQFGFNAVTALNLRRGCFVGVDGFTLASFELGEALLVVVLILGVMSVVGDGLADEPGGYLDFTCLL